MPSVGRSAVKARRWRCTDRRIDRRTEHRTQCAVIKTGAPVQPGFKRVLAAEAASNFGSMLSRLAIPWLATLVLLATPLQMGFLLLADVAAGALGAMLLGTLVDRLRKRSVMVAADLMRAVLLGLLALGAALNVLSFTALVLAAAASGMLTMAFELARSAWMAQALAQGELTARNAQLAATASLSETAAFAIGGWLFQWWGAAVALAADGLSYIASAICLRGVADAAPAKPEPEPALGPQWRAMVAQAREGLATLVQSPKLRAMAFLQALVALSMSLTATSYMIFVARDIGLPTGTLGLIFATGGLGAIVGAALARPLGQRVGPERAMALGLLLAALGAACIPAVPGAAWWGVALLVLHQVVGDSGSTVYDVHGRTLRQTVVTQALLARVDAGIRTLEHVALIIGALGGGLLATWAGARATLVLCALLLFSAALVALYLPRRG